MDTAEIKNIAILGATGSIGRQTIDIVRRHPGRYRATVVAGGSRVDALAEAAAAVMPRLAVIADRSRLAQLKSRLEPLGIECAAGPEALAECVTADDVDTVVTATVGYSGLEPTVAAIKAGKDIALANKETLVVAGDLINKLLKDSDSKIYPVDSEHSAIAQCLAGEEHRSIDKLIITASGGPFRTWTKQQIAGATCADALRHPNWSMGAKITIDSATMMNKAFELIEAHHLFDISAEKIVPVVHPQSIVHSMVQFSDGAVKAQLGLPDMHLPIAYALGAHTRLPGAAGTLTLEQMATLTFERPDYDRFPCLSFAHIAMERRGTSACIINAANEIAVAAFLNGKIGFYDIYDTVCHTLGTVAAIQNPEFADYVATNAEARAVASEFINTIK